VYPLQTSGRCAVMGGLLRGEYVVWCGSVEASRRLASVSAGRASWVY
jgi:hypothetical protein